MFLKKLFGTQPQNNPQIPEPLIETQGLPAGHPKFAPGQQATTGCPFMNKNNSSKTKEQQLQDDEDDMPRGGCPFMGGGSNAKKNPPLQLTNECFDEIFVSKYRFYLSDSKIDFDFMESHKQKRNRERTVFNKYPIYLQHSLFYQTEDIKAVRNLQCCSRFMAFEELREKGNKQFNKGNFLKSLDYYERAYSLFKWLEHQQPEIQQIQSSVCQSMADIDSSIDQGETSKIQMNFQTQKQIPTKPNDDFRKQYKEFFVLYCDENTKLFDGQEMTEKYDTDMRKSLMVQILMNMSATYIMLSNYSVAYSCCAEAELLTDKMSQIQFRKAQTIVLNQSSSLQKLYEAKELIQTALNKKPSQKIFNQVNPNILKMLNLHDAQQAYTKCLEKVDLKIQMAKTFVLEKQNNLFQRAAQIHQAELDIIARGMEPYQRKLQTDINETVQFRVIKRMEDKYLRVIDFYTESDKPDQIKAAKRELQEVLRVSHEMKTIANIKMADCPTDMDLGDRDSDKVKRRLQKIKLEHAQEPYNKGIYNFQVLEWAIKEIVQEDHKKQEQIKQKEKQMGGQLGIKTQSKFSYLWILVLLPILGIFASRLLF